MSEFTTIQISKDVKQKLDLVKGENNNTYNMIIEKLLKQSAGTIVDDTIEIAREQVAFSLKYLSDTEQKIRDVTYHEIANMRIGDKVTAWDSPTADNYVNSSVRVLAKYGDDVILLLEDVSFSNGRLSTMTSVIHVVLF